jgi:hypothetical protein
MTDSSPIYPRQVLKLATCAGRRQMGMQLAGGGGCLAELLATHQCTTRLVPYTATAAMGGRGCGAEALVADVWCRCGGMGPPSALRRTSVQTTCGSGGAGGVDSGGQRWAWFEPGCGRP